MLPFFQVTTPKYNITGYMQNKANTKKNNGFLIRIRYLIMASAAIFQFNSFFHLKS